MHLKITAIVLLSAWALCAGGVLPYTSPAVGRFRRSSDMLENAQPVLEPTQMVESAEDPGQSKAGGGGKAQPGLPDMGSLVPSLMNNTLFNERGTMVMGAFSVMFMPMPSGSDMANVFQNGFSMFPTIPGVPSLPGLPTGRR